MTLYDQKFKFYEVLGIKFGSHQYPYLLIQTVFSEKEAKTILLDICCGTGSIGIALADRFDKVYGIEMVQSAIDDANMNIKKNNLENCIFECGKAENRMRDISIEVSKFNQNTVAIVDPPRAGLNKKVIGV